MTPTRNVFASIIAADEVIGKRNVVEVAVLKLCTVDPLRKVQVCVRLNDGQTIRDEFPTMRIARVFMATMFMKMEDA